MTKSQLEALRKIIYAVESGGQVYGACDYGNYTEAYTNSDIEHGMTIGAGQWYGEEAKVILQRIKEAGGKGFTNTLKKALKNEDWETYSPSAGSDVARAIKGVLTTEIGKREQDAYMEKQLGDYCKDAESMGVKDADAQAMCANFAHQGGRGATARLLVKAGKPYTLDGLYEACKSDTGNQVGAYKARQAFVYKAIKEHLGEGKEAGVTATRVLDKARSFLGCNMYDGSHRQIIDAYNNHTPRARGYMVGYEDHWCDTFVSAVFILLDAVSLIGGTECGVEEHVKLFKAAGIWNEDGASTPDPGDIIVFNWDDNTQPNDGFSDHIGIVEKVENGLITAIEGNSGGAVKRNTYEIGNGFIRGFARPKYASSDEKESGQLEPGEIATEKSPIEKLQMGELGKTPVCTGEVTTIALNVRSWAGTSNPVLNSIPVIYKGEQVGICGRILGERGELWYYVKIRNEIYGFVHSDYIAVGQNNDCDD